jgi:hypothetical protein
MVMFAEDIKEIFLAAWQFQPMAAVNVDKERAAL